MTLPTLNCACIGTIPVTQAQRDIMRLFFSFWFPASRPIETSRFPDRIRQWRQAYHKPPRPTSNVTLVHIDSLQAVGHRKSL